MGMTVALGSWDSQPSKLYHAILFMYVALLKYKYWIASAGPSIDLVKILSLGIIRK